MYASISLLGFQKRAWITDEGKQNSMKVWDYSGKDRHKKPDLKPDEALWYKQH